MAASDSSVLASAVDFAFVAGLMVPRVIMWGVWKALSMIDGGDDVEGGYGDRLAAHLYGDDEGER